jgi:hypothetical protein
MMKLETNKSLIIPKSIYMKKHFLTTMMVFAFSSQDGRNVPGIFLIIKLKKNK